MAAIPEFDRSPRSGAGPLIATSRRTRNAYEGGAHTKRTMTWRAPTVGANSGVISNLTTLRDRSRQATRNNGYAKGAIEKKVTNIIGTGIKPMSQADDLGLRKTIDDLFLQWTDESDADGLLDFYGQQTQAAWGWHEGGEMFARLRPRLESDGLSVPIQVQLIEPELCPHTYNATLPNGNRVRAGIEFDAIGRRVAYWFYTSRPGDLQDFDASEMRRISAESVHPLFQPLRAGQLRGLPDLTQALVRLHEIDKVDDAVVLREQIQNLFAGFITRETAVDDTTTNPLTDAAADDTDEDERETIVMEPATMQELEPGEDVKFSTPPGVPSTYIAFMKQQLYAVSAAVGVPYETLTGDMSNVNDRTVRVILNEFRRRIMALQHQIFVFQWCRPIWNAWMDRAVLTGKLPISAAAYELNRTPFARVKWVPQGWPYIHPLQDVEAKERSVRGGFSSRSDEVGQQGDDAVVIDQQQHDDNTRADDLGLKYDSDSRYNKSEKAALAQQSDGGSGDDNDGAGGDRRPREREQLV